MDSRNPVFGRSEGFSAGPTSQAAAVDAATVAQMEQSFAGPSAGPARTGRMTYDDVVVRTGMTFVVLLVGAAIGWTTYDTIPGLYMVGFVGGLVLGLVNAFKKEPSPALIMGYAVLEGIFLGGISSFLDTLYPGIATQAVLGTFAVFAVALVAYRSRWIRVTPKSRRIFFIAIAGYLVFSVVNLFLMLFGVTDSPFGLRSGFFGVAIGILAIGLASFSLVLDFDFIERGVNQGIPERYAWTAAFGLVVTLVWLYIEILRLLAILQQE